MQACGLGTRKNFARLQKILAIAIEKHLFDREVFLTYILMALRCKKTTEAMAMFHNPPNPNYICQETYHLVIDRLMLNRDHYTANSLWDEYAEQYKINTAKQLDLHQFRYGSAYIAVMSYLHQWDSSKHNYKIITGKGLHSTLSHQELHTTKRAFLDALDDFEAKTGATVKEEQFNVNAGVTFIKDIRYNETPTIARSAAAFFQSAEQQSSLPAAAAAAVATSGLPERAAP